MTVTQVRAAVYIGVRDMVLHRLAAGAGVTDYPDPPAGPGGHFGYALCGEPAYGADTTGTRLLTKCPVCNTRMDAAVDQHH